MSTLAERWHAAVEAAVEMATPREIVALIRAADEPDDGLRAGTYEARVSVGHKSDSHPERMLLDERYQGSKPEWWKRDDERKVAREGLRFIDAISAINAARDEGTCDTWDEAVKDAHFMSEYFDGGFITSCIELDMAEEAERVDGRRPLSPYYETIRAIETLGKIARCWGAPHVATIQERLTHPDVCLSHARIGEERPVSGRFAICRMCRELIQRWESDPIKVHHDADAWPTLEMLRANLEGRSAEYKRLLGEWLAEHGVKPDGRPVTNMGGLRT